MASRISPSLTPAQRIALDLASRNGAVKHVSRWGPITTGMLKGLVRRGLMELIPDNELPPGEYRAWYRPTETGRHALAESEQAEVE